MPLQIRLIQAGAFVDITQRGSTCDIPASTVVDTRHHQARRLFVTTVREPILFSKTACASGCALVVQCSFTLLVIGVAISRPAVAVKFLNDEVPAFLKPSIGDKAAIVGHTLMPSRELVSP